MTKCDVLLYVNNNDFSGNVKYANATEKKGQRACLLNHVDIHQYYLISNLDYHKRSFNSMHYTPHLLRQYESLT